MSREPESGSSPERQRPTRTALAGKLGLVLILLSGVCFFSMLSVPWWPVSATARVVTGGVLFVAMQIAWWAGAALAGPATLAALRSWSRALQARFSRR